MPERMKATGRVNSPSRSKQPPNASSTAARPWSESSSTGPISAGYWNNFAVPCAMNRNAMTMRNRLNKWGLDESGRCLRLMRVSGLRGRTGRYGNGRQDREPRKRTVGYRRSVPYQPPPPPPPPPPPEDPPPPELEPGAVVDEAMAL